MLGALRAPRVCLILRFGGPWRLAFHVFCELRAPGRSVCPPSGIAQRVRRLGSRVPIV